LQKGCRLSPKARREEGVPLRTGGQSCSFRWSHQVQEAGACQLSLLGGGRTRVSEGGIWTTKGKMLKWDNRETDPNKKTPTRTSGNPKVRPRPEKNIKPVGLLGKSLPIVKNEHPHQNTDTHHETAEKLAIAIDRHKSPRNNRWRRPSSPTTQGI